jgi:hypothetical protein
MRKPGERRACVAVDLDVVEIAVFQKEEDAYRFPPGSSP